MKTWGEVKGSIVDLSGIEHPELYLFDKRGYIDCWYPVKLIEASNSNNDHEQNKIMQDALNNLEINTPK